MVEKKNPNFIKGKWIVLYPDHDSMDASGREVYGKIQDSIVQLKGLKLLGFEEGGLFYQADSFDHPGNWKIWNDAEKRLVVKDGGAGFSAFTTTLFKDQDSLVILTELVKYKGLSMRLDWNLKRLNDKYASFFFSKENNKWRVKPAGAESPKEIKERLHSMLEYYSMYYDLVGSESTYFIPARISMPFKFYQHAVGLRPLSSDTSFQHFFYDASQAGQAHGYLEQVMERLRGQFPTVGDSYVKEYAEYMKLMSGEMKSMTRE